MTRGIFYLGGHKVGSSILQEHLTLNSHKLMEQGVLYPFVEPDGLSYAFAKSACGRAPTDLPFKIKSAHNHIGYKMLAEMTDTYKVPERYRPLPASRQMMQTVRALLKATGAQTLVLCSEMFIQFGTRAPAAIGTLLELSGVERATGYAVLRRPDQYLASWQSQLLKFGATQGRLSDETIRRFVGTCHLEFHASVAPWAERLGPGNLDLLTYDDLKTQGGSIADFTRRYDLQVKRPVSAKGKNTGLPFAIYDTVRQANEVLKTRRTPFMRWCIRAAAKLDIPANRDVELFGQDNRAWLVERFRDENRKLGALVGAEAFFPDLEAALETHPISEAEASAAGFAAIRKAYLGQEARKRDPEVVAWLERTTRLAS